MAEVPLPSADLRSEGKPPLLFTWAHAGGKAVVRLEAGDSMPLACDIYQVNGRSVVPVSRHVALPALDPGANRLDLPLPEKSARGRLLFKIADATGGRVLVNLMVDILPADAWNSLVEHSKQGRVWIDPEFKVFHAWAAAQGISSTPSNGRNSAEFYFGTSAGNTGQAPSGRVLVFEREQPAALPVIEVVTVPEVTKIILPPGFLAEVPDSATAQAMLLQYLRLLP